MFVYRWTRLGLLSSVFLAAALLSAGCGAPASKVTGKVAYKGKNLDSGQVSLLSLKGGTPYTGDIQEDGTYTIANVPYGDYAVTVIQYPKDQLSPAEANKDRKEKGGRDDTPKKKSTPTNLLPKQYANHEGSPLKVTVDRAEISKDLTLTD